MKTLITILLINITFSQIFNTTQGTEHSNLIEAVQLSNSGDTIQTQPGTYSGYLTIDKALNLEGSPGSIIDATNQYFGISIAASNVTVSGFEVIGNEYTVSGITVNPGSANITINNNVIHGMGFANPSNESPLSYGILAWGNDEIPNPPSNVTISNNEIYDVTGAGISLGEVTQNISILNNYIHNINAVVLPENIIPSQDFTSIGITGLVSENVLIDGNIFENLTVGSSFGISSGTISNNTYNSTSVLFSSIFFNNNSDDYFDFNESSQYWRSIRDIQNIFSMYTYCSSIEIAQSTAGEGTTILSYDNEEIVEDCNNQWGGSNFGVCDSCATNLLGDANYDGFIDVLDVVLVVSLIVNETITSELETCISDLDLNNEINVIDVVALLQLIIND
tara:strand:+ start:1228 stop:2406 length:1179 start_codon:yes stop_codon:yes gene_type:complete